MFHSFASALTYYGICFSVGSFGVNIYLAQFFSGLSEAPSLLLPFLLKRWGRRPFSMGSLFLSGISCMLSLLVSKFCGEGRSLWNTIHEHSLMMIWYCLILSYMCWFIRRISLLQLLFAISLSEQTCLPLLWLWRWWASCVCSLPPVSLCSMGLSFSQL